MSEEVEKKEEVKEETKVEEVVAQEAPKKEKKAKRPKSKARKIIEWVLTGIFLAFFVVIMVGQVDGFVHKNDHYGQQIRLGYATFVVKTTSMEPEIKKDSAIVTYLEPVEKIVDRFNKGEKVDLTFIDGYNVNDETTKPYDNPELTLRTSVDTRVPITHRVREIHDLGNGHYVFIAAGINVGDKAGTDAEGRIYQYQAFSEKEILGRVVTNSPFLGGVFGFISSPFGLLALLLIPACYLVITSVLDIFKAYKDPEEAVAEGGSAPSSNGNVELSEEDKKRLKEELLKEMIEKKKGGQ